MSGGSDGGGTTTLRYTVCMAVAKIVYLFLFQKLAEEEARNETESVPVVACVPLVDNVDNYQNESSPKLLESTRGGTRTRMTFRVGGF